jgi:hypothetical protein
MHEKEAGGTPLPTAVVLIYAELAERLGIGREAARLQAKRQRWEVLPDGGGIARVGVPAQEPPAARVGRRRLPSSVNVARGYTSTSTAQKQMCRPAAEASFGTHGHAAQGFGRLE